MDKVSRIDSVRNSINSEKELCRRLPEIDAIYDEEIRDATIKYFLTYVPDYFWERAASASGKYHPTDERDDHGLWLHTKRVFYEYANLSESLLELDEITEEEREAGKAAALIHDTFHRGWPSANTNKSSQDHDKIAAALASEIDRMPEETVNLVDSHMGPWANGKCPETSNERCFHLSDKSAAAANHTQGVYFPAEELQSIETVTKVGVDKDEVV